MTILPEDVQLKIKSLVEHRSLHLMSKEIQALSFHYRKERTGSQSLRSLQTEKQHLAYLIGRMPATYAAIVEVLNQLQKKGDEPRITSLLDVGAGPATALLGALSSFPSLKQATCIEKDPLFVQLGKYLTNQIQNVEIDWVNKDFLHFPFSDQHDLVVAAYSLGELKSSDQLVILSALWRATSKLLVIIEPGTPFAFEQIKTMRNFLISQGGALVAPCPHPLNCPMKEGDWCHFSARLPRSSEHRKIKSASLNYEDEKFSYLIFSKDPVTQASSRIIRHPFRGKGFVKFKICSPSGLVEKTVSKKNKDNYKESKKLKWGDIINIDI